MDLQSELLDMEERLRTAGVSVNAVCKKASIYRSTWTRWKAGHISPNYRTLEAVRSAFRELVA
jgi:hypothetical protein